MSAAKSRWDHETAEDRAAAALQKAEKAAKKAAKEARKRAEAAQQAAAAAAAAAQQPPSPKRRRIDSPSATAAETDDKGKGKGKETEREKGKPPLKLVRYPAPEIKPCRHVDDVYEKLNHIEEGSYGVVSRARDIHTGQLVALKKLKLERETEGFPITSLREIQTLLAGACENVVAVREVVMGDTLKDVFIVMDFVEHDLATLLAAMPEPFLLSETKTLLHQLLTGVDYLHSHWILHRDLKTSNLLLNNRGVLKIADFGLARYTGDPVPPLTQLVVTLWYRAPELLLGARTYGPEIDLWSVGCIFAELLTREALLQGKNELDQVSKVFDLLGVPSETTWPGWKRLPNAKGLTFPPQAARATANLLRKRFPTLTTRGVDVLQGCLTLDPAQRWSAEEALKCGLWEEEPRKKAREMLPTWPSKASGERRRRIEPGAPVRGDAPELHGEVGGLFAEREEEVAGAGFALRMG